MVTALDPYLCLLMKRNEHADVRMVAAESCPALSYPRTLHGVLDAEDRQHLSSIYFEQAQQWGGRSYYNLLHHLAATPHDDRSWRALRRVEERVAREFGDRFVMM